MHARTLWTPTKTKRNTIVSCREETRVYRTLVDYYSPDGIFVQFSELSKIGA